MLGRTPTAWDQGRPGWTWREVLVAAQMYGRRLEQKMKAQRAAQEEIEQQQFKREMAADLGIDL